METKEFTYKGLKISGFFMLFIMLLLVAGFASCLALEMFLIPPICAVLIALIPTGFIVLEPNEASVMLFFGKYRGTFKDTGFYWINPFVSKKKVSLRARNIDVQPIKVNDKIGNPVMIGLVLVWKLKDSYKAMFEIDSQTIASSGLQIGNGKAVKIMEAFEKFVNIQSDAALREVAGSFAYDNDGGSDSKSLTLRGGGDEINELLEVKLNERLDMAGIEIVEARINYLAYSPEIASVMLRRQQASAIISAREKIVEGAVGMVKLALDKLDEEGIELDPEKRAAMVSNLLVVLCSDESAQPVINTGTLNH